MNPDPTAAPDELEDFGCFNGLTAFALQMLQSGKKQAHTKLDDGDGAPSTGPTASDPAAAPNEAGDFGRFSGLAIFTLQSLQPG